MEGFLLEKDDSADVTPCSLLFLCVFEYAVLGQGEVAKGEKPGIASSDLGHQWVEHLNVPIDGIIGSKPEMLCSFVPAVVWHLRHVRHVRYIHHVRHARYFRQRMIQVRRIQRRKRCDCARVGGGIDRILRCSDERERRGQVLE